MDLVTWLKGKKTYIVALVAAVLNFLVAINAISPAHLAQVNAVLAALGLAALRAGVNNAVDVAAKLNK